MKLVEPQSAGTEMTNPWQIRWHKVAVRVRIAYWAVRHWLGTPGYVPQSWEIDDLVTGQYLKIRTDPFYTILQVNGRDYYFRRHDGKFDGTGMGCL